MWENHQKWASGVFWCLERIHQRTAHWITCRIPGGELQGATLAKDRDGQGQPGGTRCPQKVAERGADKAGMAAVQSRGAQDRSEPFLCLSTFSFLLFPCQQGEHLALPLHLAWRIMQGPLGFWIYFFNYSQQRQFICLPAFRKHTQGRSLSMTTKLIRINGRW